MLLRLFSWVSASIVLACACHTDGRAADSHAENPVYTAVVADGIRLPNGTTYRLSEPDMPDGLNVSQQQERLTKILGDLPTDRFLRDSQVAPHICRLQEIAADDTQAVRQIDVFFVVHVTLDKVVQHEFVGHLGDGEEEATGRELTVDELKARMIMLEQVDKEGQRHESYATAQFSMLNQVELQLTGRSYWSRTEDSLVAATMVDPRFGGDSMFPNVWRTIKRNKETDTVERGESQEYGGAASYMKITRLREPDTAVLVEGHTIFVEPRAWFGNPNQLRGKIPAIVQTQIRAARREMVKEARK